MTFVIFCLQVWGALRFMLFVSHLSHSNASVQQLSATLSMTSLSAPPLSVLIVNSLDLLPCLKHLRTFFLSHTFSTVSLLDGILDPSMSLSSFYSLFHPSWLPDCLSPPLPLATACWIKHCWSLSQRICRLHKICLPSFYPITDGSSKLIKTWVRQMLHLIFYF